MSNPIVNADFLNNAVNAKGPFEGPDLSSPDRFFNRELSWLQFDWRVLEEAMNESVPLLERVRFLSISGSNLDEFYSVRVAALRSLVRQGIETTSVDGLTPAAQLEKIDAEVRLLEAKQLEVWRVLVKLLAQEDILILSRKDLRKADLDALEDVFMDEVFPVLTPIAIDPAHPFPFIPNGEFALALRLERVADKERLEALLPIPQQLDRFVRLSPGPKGEIRFLPLEVLLETFVTRIFPGYEITSASTFRLLRDSDLELQDEAEDLVREFETALRRRRRGDVIRLEFASDVPDGIMSSIFEALGITKDDAVFIDGLIGMQDTKEIVDAERSDLKFARYVPRMPERVVEDFDGDIFGAIRQKDLLLHHPYETFDTVVKFLEQAARDPNVVAIKQTLYRTSRNSPIVAALCEASEAGKSVVALVELKARFDEAANIRQSRQLERAGVQVVYGFMDWKTHAKLSTVVRKENGKLVTYSHMGTGNYHPVTANIYTDLSLFTCDAAVGRDTSRIFNYVSGYARPDELENLAIAPHMLKQTILRRLDEEIEHAKAGRPAAVWAKVNALIEPEVIDGLYRASQAGVKIDLVVRSICGLKPGIKGLSENIRVKSVVGRFLEHSRICCFGNGHGLPSKEARVYISSADWMGRNLNRRVETMVEIKNPTVHAQIVEQIMAANMYDQAQSWVLQSDGSYIRHPRGKDELFNCHHFFMEHPSLSGRGRVGAEDAPQLIKDTKSTN